MTHRIVHVKTSSPATSSSNIPGRFACICHFGVTQSPCRLQASALNKKESVQTAPNYFFFLITYSRNVQILRYSFSLVSHWCWLPYQQSHGGEMQYSQHLPCRPELLTHPHVCSLELTATFKNPRLESEGKKPKLKYWKIFPAVSHRPNSDNC